MLGEINPNQKYAFAKFGKKFCDGHSNGFGMNYNGSSNTDELHEILQRYMVRRLKTDVLPNLTKQRIPIVVESHLPKEYRDIEKRLHKMEKGDTYMALAMTGRRHLSKCKADSAIDFAKGLVEDGQPVVLVAEFNETLDKMMQEFGDDACCIRGGMSDVAKQKAIDEFQNGEKQVCCINMIAAGVGITLTRAHNMVVCDFDWTPANMTQVEDRICRSGQKEPCNIFYICHEQAILDDIFMEMITDKSANIDKVVDKAENTVDLVGMREDNAAPSGADDFLSRLKARIEADNAASDSDDKPKRTRKSATPKGGNDDGDANGDNGAMGTPEPFAPETDEPDEETQLGFDINDP
jgi:SNF2 family DNA or RNA helicase